MFFSSGIRPFRRASIHGRTSSSSFAGPNGQPLRTFGLIDTGADYSTLPLEVARQLGVSIYKLKTFEANEASGSLELGVARDPVSATLASRSFEL